jgi:hypothetical protein
MPANSLPYTLELYGDHDIVVMRQAVRQVTRQCGFTLMQQAKMCAAANTIARAALLAKFPISILMYTETIKNRSALLISFQILPANIQMEQLIELIQILRFGEAQLLVDEATLSFQDNGAVCTLRMWMIR